MCLLQVYERVLYSVNLFLLDNRGAVKRRNKYTVFIELGLYMLALNNGGFKDFIPV